MLAATDETGRDKPWVTRTGTTIRMRANAVPIEVVLGVIAVCAAVLVLLMTRSGLGGLPPDSGVYLSTAEHLGAGRGFTTHFDTLFDHFGPSETAGFHGDVPLVAWSPGFPALMALFSFFGSESDGARVVNVVATGILVYLSGFIVLRITQSRARAVITAVVVTILPGVLVFSGLVLSETMYVAVALAALVAAYQYAERQTWVRFAFVAVAGVLGVATRLAGVALPIALGAAVFLSIPGAWRRRLALGAGAAAPGVLFALIWRARDASSPLTAHLPGKIDVQTIAQTLGTWFGTGRPTTGRVLSILLGLALFCLATYTAFRPRERAGERALSTGLGALMIMSVVVVAFARSFTDAQVPFNGRVLLPGIVSLALLVASARFEWSATANRVLAGALVAVAVLAVWPWAVRGGWILSPSGSTTTAKAISSTAFPPYYPPITATLRKLPPGRIVSDYPENTWFYADRPSIHMPSKEDVTAGRHNDDFEAQMREVGRVLQTGDFVVLYRCPSDAAFFPTVDEIRRFVDLTTVYEQPDGCIYRVT